MLQMKQREHTRAQPIFMSCIILPEIMILWDSKMLAPLCSSSPDVLHANHTGVSILCTPVYSGHVLSVSGSDKAEHSKGTYYLWNKTTRHHLADTLAYRVHFP